MQITGWALGDSSPGKSLTRADDHFNGRIQRMAVTQMTWRSTEPLSVSTLLLAAAVRIE